MYKKLLSTILTFSIVIAVTSIIVTTVVLYYFFSEQLKNELKNEVGFLKPGVETQGVNYLKEVTVPERMTLISPNGDVIFDNFREPPLENHLNREEVKNALENGEGLSYRYSETLNETTYNYAIKLKNGDVLRLSMDQASIFQILFGFIQIYLFIILGAVLISYLISKKLISSIISSIEDIDPERPLDHLSYPEINPLLIKINNQNRLIKAQLEEVLRHEADFETITANMNEGIIVTDQEGKIKNINDSAEILLNLKPTELGSSIFLPINNTELKQLIQNALKGTKDSLVLNQGETTLSIIVSPIVIKEEQSGIVIIIIDVTERAQMEKLRSEYVANVSHELKTPLTSISGFAEIMNNGIVKPEDIPHFSGKIYDEAQHLIDVVNDILTISYLDENANKVIKVGVDLEILAKNVIDRLENRANHKKITIKLVVRGDVDIIGNYDILYDMLYNLIDNAIKYNKENGKVVVYLNGTQDNDIIIKVMDSGYGIPSDEKERIFKRFYRLSKSRFNRNEGTGLGLSIVKHAALVHHATVNILSKPLKGSIFVIEIPRIN